MQKILNFSKLSPQLSATYSANDANTLYSCVVVVKQAGSNLWWWSLYHEEPWICHHMIMNICNHPRENRPSSHLVMIVEIPVLKVLVSVTSFYSC